MFSLILATASKKHAFYLSVSICLVFQKVETRHIETYLLCTKKISIFKAKYSEILISYENFQQAVVLHAICWHMPALSLREKLTQWNEYSCISVLIQNSQFQMDFLAFFTYYCCVQVMEWCWRVWGVWLNWSMCSKAYIMPSSNKCTMPSFRLNQS